MRTRIAALAVCIAIAVLGFVAVNYDMHAQPNENRTIANDDRAGAQLASVERGQYIVHHVAMCIYCHTPRSDDGVPDRHRLLQGAPMPVESPFPQQTWAFQAPKIAGLPGGWTEKEMVHFLQSGESPTGRQPQPPMPPFRFTEQDALSVAAYLKSLQ